MLSEQYITLLWNRVHEFIAVQRTEITETVAFTPLPEENKFPEFCDAKSKKKKKYIYAFFNTNNYDIHPT
jgi:hypothetical protein